MNIRHDVTPAMRRAMARSYRQGASIRQCAAEVGLSYGAARNTLLALKVKIRPHGWKRQK